MSAALPAKPVQCKGSRTEKSPDFNALKACNRVLQPEVAAEAITWAADHSRREVWVGASTYEAILGQKVAPDLLDRFLGKSGYQSQQYDGPEDPNRPDNLWDTVRGNQSAHGSFDDRAHPKSSMLWVTEHRGWFVLAGILAGSVIASRLRAIIPASLVSVSHNSRGEDA